MLEPLTDPPAQEHAFLDTFLASSFLAFPVVYIALDLAWFDGVSAIGDGSGVVFFGAIIVGPAVVGAVVALIRVLVGR